MDRFDLVCIGGGPAGQKAAIQAAKCGKRAALIDANERLKNLGSHRHGAFQDAAGNQQVSSEASPGSGPRPFPGSS